MDAPHSSLSSLDLTVSNEAELLGDMAQASAPERARAAWGELFSRHRRYVFAVVHRAYGTFLGEDGTVDLVVDTFRKAYEWAGRQPDRRGIVERFTGESPDATRRKVLGWLGAIAERLFKDRFREDARKAEDFQQYVEQWEGADAQSPTTAPSTPAPLEDALATLGPEEAEALRVSLPWYEPSTQSFAVPRGEAARVAALLGVSPGALRQRRHRALKKIEEFLRDAHRVGGEVS